MNSDFRDKLLRATRLTGAMRLGEATALVQRVLHGLVPSSADRQAGEHQGPTIDGTAEDGADIGQTSQSTDQSATQPSGAADAVEQPPLPEALRGLFEGLPGVGSLPLASGQLDPLPPGAEFLDGTYTNEAGTRSYKLYVPSGYRGRPVALIVMLHGCTQSPDDFAAGTRMNLAAEDHTCLVLYPAQSAAANTAKCWNWFDAAHQQRDRGEPSLIAGMTREVMRQYRVDPGRVYIAGLSAGGAAASIMAETYPDLYAAVGVHSGLARGAASDLPSAMAAMRNGNARHDSGPGAAHARGRFVPTIVFHGDRDTTVHPANGDDVIAHAASATPFAERVEEGQVPNGRAWRRTLHVDAAGYTRTEQWVINGAGHAWSGGSAAGSFTDPRGPDATREMLRFFLEHARSSAKAA
jgi:poly(hydroxyalkanoate) depolymerase family esterase